jgi:predicted nucleic acid-binding protein
MEKTDTLADTGLIVGLLHKGDQHHNWAKQQFDRVSAPLFTCEAVLSEAFHLLEPVPTGTERLLSVLDRGIFDLSFSYLQHATRIHDLVRTYADQPMSFADACLVRMAEGRRAPSVVTTDDDFHVYRTAGDEPLDVRLPTEK